MFNMKKINEDNVNKKNMIILPDYISSESRLFLLPDDSIYKEFKGNLLHENRHRVKYLRDKLKYADSMPEELIMPTRAVYDTNSHLVGYTMNKVNGINIEKLEEAKSPFDKTDLTMYRDMYYKLKDIIVKSGDNVVFPNLLDTRNIFIDRNGNMSLICFDDMQIDDIEGYYGSDTECNYGGPELRSKKYYNNGLFTKNMDIRSLIYIYFLLVFNFNLNYFSPYDEDELNEKITNVFYTFGIDDSEIVSQVENLFSTEAPNEYIDDFVDYITDECMLYYFYDFRINKPMKRLVLK